MRYEKLVRDKISGFSALAGDSRRFTVARKSDMPPLLYLKLMEEAAEVNAEMMSTPLNKKKLIEELADCLEVIEAITDHFEIGEGELACAKALKKGLKGGFRDRIVLDLSTNPEKFK